MRLLIVGPFSSQLSQAAKIAMDRGASVAQVDDVDSALKALRSGRGADIVMIDVGQPIARLVRQLEDERIHVPVVACGINTNARAAVEAIRAGAKEYIPLPPDPDMIAAVLAAVAEEARDLVTVDPTMQRVVKLAEQVAASEASILITGESGTGKEVVARHVHRHSRRANGPFIAVNCAAIPEHLLESELFGHEKGAFTGALARRVGKFEEADGGTLLLDEISEMDIRLQSKLLRAIQERLIDRVGGTKPVAVDIRILATSNRDLAEAVRNQTFREDLLYRLNVVNLKLPPLRERPADIVALADHFAAKYAKINGFKAKSIAADAKAALQSARWQGNVRELENCMHRAVLLSTEAEIGLDAIRMPDGSRIIGSDGAPVVAAAPSPLIGQPARGYAPSSPVERAAQTAEAVTRALVGRTVADVERDLILSTLDHCLGNRTHASNILGISIRTLRNKLNEYADEGIVVPAPGESRQQVA
ncbi:MAG: sigma-54-dependent Fis family transcriptional regulator [Hyphomicrobiaceae bacterium]|nr:sigma-54-dependent Fis family transcriptional regulator [Hyphomicrobiaceae bacterium]